MAAAAGDDNFEVMLARVAARLVLLPDYCRKPSSLEAELDIFLTQIQCLDHEVNRLLATIKVPGTRKAIKQAFQSLSDAVDSLTSYIDERPHHEAHDHAIGRNVVVANLRRVIDETSESLELLQEGGSRAPALRHKRPEVVITLPFRREMLG